MLLVHLDIYCLDCKLLSLLMIHCVRGVSTGDVFCSISACLLGWGYSRVILFSLPSKFQIAISYISYFHFKKSSMQVMSQCSLCNHALQTEWNSCAKYSTHISISTFVFFRPNIYSTCSSLWACSVNCKVVKTSGQLADTNWFMGNGVFFQLDRRAHKYLILYWFLPRFKLRQLMWGVKKSFIVSSTLASLLNWQHASLIYFL